VVEYAREAEELGFDGLWTGDHLLWRTEILEPTTTLAAITSVTRRVSIGTNVYLLGLRPSLISAKVLGTLDYLSENRLILGVGVGGESPAEFEGAGVPLNERGARLDDTLAGVREWWAWNGTGAAPPVRPAPSPSLPVWVGGRSEAALRRAVRERAAAWTAHFVGPEQVGAMRARLRELAREAGVEPPEVAVTLNINASERGPAEARAFAEAHFGMPAERIERHLHTGTVEECAERVAAYADVCEHVVLFPVSFDVVGQLRRLAAVVDRVRPHWKRAQQRLAGEAGGTG
jgi:alkanesulfonate monooxygenase SsuD/methylene tetrahydromethanopterin reductase-like flavin-dependent oxidoreductase (luciferase family)